VTAPAAPSERCPRLVRERGYARTFCDRPAGAGGVCRRHRYVEKQQRAERARRHAAMQARGAAA
jgi:hypothetical protein